MNQLKNMYIYQVLRTNGNTNRYEYIGTNIKNAKATFILYYLFSSDSIRIDHDQWKLAVCKIDPTISLNEHEYYTIDSLEMNRLKKQYPNYTHLLSSIPWEIDEITLDNQIYDDYISVVNRNADKNIEIDITNLKNLKMNELIDAFNIACTKLPD